MRILEAALMAALCCGVWLLLRRAVPVMRPYLVIGFGPVRATVRLGRRAFGRRTA